MSLLVMPRRARNGPRGRTRSCVRQSKIRSSRYALPSWALSKASDNFLHLGQQWTCIALHRQPRRTFGLVSARDFGRSRRRRMTLSCRDGELRQRKCKSELSASCTAPAHLRLPLHSSCYRSRTLSTLLRTFGLRNGAYHLRFALWAARPNRLRELLQPNFGLC